MRLKDTHRKALSFYLEFVLLLSVHFPSVEIYHGMVSSCFLRGQARNRKSGGFS